MTFSDPTLSAGTFDLSFELDDDDPPVNLDSADEEPLISIISRGLLKSFDDEQTPDGVPWAPLKRVTIDDRARHGYGPTPTGVRTGRMRQGLLEGETLLETRRFSWSYPKSPLTRLEQVSGFSEFRPFIGWTESMKNDVRNYITFGAQQVLK